MSPASQVPLVNRSKLEAEIQCGSHAGICRGQGHTLSFYTVVMVVQKEEVKRIHSASEVGR